MPEAVIVASARTPIGRAFKGSLISVRPDDLLAHAVGAALAKVPGLDPATLDDLLVGCWLGAGEQGGNIARRVAVLLGLEGVPGATTNRACTSSMHTTRTAFHAIKSGEVEAVVSAGVESVSRYPMPRAGGTTDPEFKHPTFTAGGLPDIYQPMGQTAENVAELRGVSRADQDAYALLSQQRTTAAQTQRWFQAQIAPVTLADGTVVDRDDSPRPATTLEGLAALPPAFRVGGSVTAGNACPLNDGAAALVVMSDRRAAELDIAPLARIVSTGVSALNPEIMGLGPVEATRRALALAGMSVGDLDAVEMNEAFAAQVLPCIDDLGLDVERVNPNGGAIALGHPFGMSGARLTGSLIDDLIASDGEFGLQTMCAAGGQGMAMVIQRL